MDVLLVREGTRLAAKDSISADMIAELKNGECYVCTIRRPRNPRHHRLAWGLFDLVFRNQTTYATTQELVAAIKIATGHFDTGRTVDGLPWVQPKSIRYASMDQQSFNEWWNKALDVIITKILPAVDKVDLEQQVMEMVGKG